MPKAYPASVLRFLDACIAETKRSTEAKDELAVADVLLPIAEAIYDLKALRSRNCRKLSPRATFFHRLFFSFRELVAAYQILLDFPTLARSKPPRSETLSPARLVSFWREAYLNELYIFLCRLEAYTVRVTKAYRKEPRLAGLRGFPEHFRGLVKGRLGDLIDMRGSHVHRSRYEFTDPDLHRLQLLEMLSEGSKIPEFVKLYRDALRQERIGNTETFKTITREAKDALKGVFDSFEGFMLDPDGNLAYPTDLRT